MNGGKDVPMTMSGTEHPARRWVHGVMTTRHRRTHIVIITIALVVHLALHYATFIPALREPLRGLPYFQLHVLHEAEFLLIIAYAAIVLGFRGGIIAVGVTAVSSVPFVLTPYVFGYTPRPGEIRDAFIQVSFILLMGLLITLLYDRDKRRRDAEAVMDTLRETDQLRKNFISIAAHELRNPMTAVVGFSELLLNREVPPERRREWVEAIHSEATRMTQLIEDLLNVSRIEAGAIQLRVRPLGLNELIAPAVLAAGGPNHGHLMEVRIPAELPPVAADEEKLLQVLVNLISNAMKYSLRGSRIGVYAELAEGGEAVHVRVTDEGMGISEEDQAKLFTSFYRVPQSSGQVQGTGLGLYIVKSLVELMGGQVAVRSKLGEGSVFSFSVPVWRGREDAERAVSMQTQPA